MTDLAPTGTTNLDDIYGYDCLPWDRARDPLLDESGPLGHGGTVFLGTVRPDGRPHAAGVGAVGLDGDLYFTSGPGTRKARNLAANPACTISVTLPGIDVVLEGTATRVTDRETLDRLAAIYRAGDWPVEVDAAGESLIAPFSAPSAGSPPWHLYRFTVHAVVGVATEEPHGATRWTFDR